MGRLGFTASSGGTFTEEGAVAIISAASPWNFLTNWLATKPEEEAADQVQVAQLQAGTLQQAAVLRQKTIKTVVIAGAALVGVLTITLMLKPKRSAPVAGYRRRRSRR